MRIVHRKDVIGAIADRLIDDAAAAVPDMVGNTVIPSTAKVESRLGRFTDRQILDLSQELEMVECFKNRGYITDLPEDLKVVDFGGIRERYYINPNYSSDQVISQMSESHLVDAYELGYVTCAGCKGSGWAFFESAKYGMQIERCDSCGTYGDDQAANEAAADWVHKAERTIDFCLETISGMSVSTDHADRKLGDIRTQLEKL